MTTLAEIVAVMKRRKVDANRLASDLHQDTKRLNLFNGIQKTWRKLNEESPEFPAQSVLVQRRTPEVIDTFKASMGNLFDLVLTQEVGNAAASADLVVDGITVAQAVPVTFLVWLEHQVEEIEKFVATLPTLDPARVWKWDADQGLYVTDPTSEARNAKVIEPLLLAPATDKHPAQVDKITVDKPIGYWDSIYQSGAMTVTQKNLLLAKVRALLAGIKQARERANATEVQQYQIGDAVMGYIFG